MAVQTYNLGTVTAYADAKAGGYTGTKEEWQALMASYGTTAEIAVAAKDAAEVAQGKAEDAQEAAETAQAAAEEAARTLTIDTTLTQTGQAADAKAAGDAVASLKEDLNYGLPVTMINGGYINPTGDIVENADCAYTDYIPVVGGSTVYLNNIWVAGIRSVCLYGADKTYVYTQVAGEQITETQFTIPFGVTYLRATTHVNYTVVAKYTDIQPTIANQFENARIDANKYTDLLPVNDITKNSGTVICSHATGRAWGFGFSKAYTSIAFKPAFVTQQNAAVTDGTYILDICRQENNVITEVISSETHTFNDVIKITDVTTDLFFVIKNTFSNGTRVFLAYTTTVNAVFTTTLGHISGSSLGATITPVTVGSVSGKFYNTDPTWFKWKGKTALFIGDSVTDMGVYTEPLTFMLGVDKAYNRGVSGNTVANIGSGTSFCERVDLPSSNADTHTAGMPTDADVVIIYGGINDWGKRLSSHEVLGTATAAPNTTDFCGALKYVYEAIKEKYPKARIFAIIPYRIYSDSMAVFSEMRYTNDNEENEMRFVNYNNTTFDSYRDAIKTIASYYGIPTIDLRGCGFSFFRSADRELFSNATGQSGSAAYDGIHPNAEGGYKIAKYIFDQMISM